MDVASREGTTRRPVRLAAFVSHPIQYQAPLFRALASRPEIDLEVFFYCRWGVDRYHDPEFGHDVRWDTDLLGGYSHTFLRNLSPAAGPHRFLGLINPGAFTAPRAFDAVWVHGWGTLSHWLTLLGARLARRPVLLRGEATEARRPGITGALRQRLLRSVLVTPTVGLYIGSANRRFYEACGVPGERLVFAPYSVDNASFLAAAKKRSSQRAELRRRHGINATLPVVLFCAKLIDKKQPLELLDAFASARKSVAASLVFVGDGPLRLALERKVEREAIPDVHFAGFKNQSELADFYALADLFVLPSAFEPWGLVLNEAMCFSLPALVSDQVGAAADLVDEGVTGATFPFARVDLLADRLEELLRDRDRLAVMGAAALQRVEEWSLERTAHGVVEGALRVTAQGPSPSADRPLTVKDSTESRLATDAHRPSSRRQDERPTTASSLTTPTP